MFESSAVSSKLPEPAVPSLDTEVIKLQGPVPVTYREWTSRKNRAELTATEEAYQAYDKVAYTRHLESISKCRTFAWFVRHTETGQVRVQSNACRLRWCPLCSHAKNRCVSESTLEWLKQAKAPKMLTLTLKHADSPLKTQLSAITKFFAKFRRSSFWLKNVSGGIWFIQITFSNSTMQWHPHLHIVIDSNYLPQRRISELWQSLTKTSKIVDIRSIYNPKHAAEYVARYVSRPIKLSTLTIPQRVELFEACAGKRLYGTFGNARSVVLTLKTNPDRANWINIGTWSTIISLQHSDPYAQAILKAWRESTTIPESVTLNEIDRFIADIPPPWTPVLESPNKQSYFTF